MFAIVTTPHARNRARVKHFRRRMKRNVAVTARSKPPHGRLPTAKIRFFMQAQTLSGGFFHGGCLLRHTSLVLNHAAARPYPVDSQHLADRPPFALRKAVNCSAKGRELRCERPCFTTQKAVFRRVKGRAQIHPHIRWMTYLRMNPEASC